MGKLNKKCVFLIFVLATLVVFNGVFEGKIISNVSYLFHKEPWIHHKPKDMPPSNNTMSDMVDGMTPVFHMGEILAKEHKAPLWDYSDKLGNIGLQNIRFGFFYPIRLFSWSLFGVPIGWTIEILLKFALGAFFMFLFLRQLGASQAASMVVSLAYTFGTSNIAAHQGGFSTLALTLPITFFFAENLARNRRWIDVIGAAIGFFVLGVSGFVSVTAFAVYWLFFYIAFRIIAQSDGRVFLLLKFGLAAVTAFLVAAPGLLPTAEYFLNGIDLSYREDFGLGQLTFESLIHLFWGHPTGHPLADKKLWLFGSFINASVFIGSITLASALIFAPIRMVKFRSGVTGFLLVLTALLFVIIYRFPFESSEEWTNYLPVFWGNSPSYQKIILQFFLAVSGALGLDFLLRGLPGVGVRGKRLSLVAYFALFMVAILSYAYSAVQVYERNLGELPTHMYSYFFAMLLLKSAALLIAADILIWSSKLSNELWLRLSNAAHKIFPRRGGALISFFPRKAIYGLVLSCIVMGEVLIHASGWITYSKLEWWYPRIPMVKYLEANLGPSRTMSLGRGPAVPQMMAAYGFPVAAGRGSVNPVYRGLLQRAWPDYYVDHATQTFLDPYKTDLGNVVFDLVDVKYFIASRYFEEDSLAKYGRKFGVHRFKGGKLIENLEPLGPVYFANDGLVESNREEIADAVNSSWWNPRQHVILSQAKDLLRGDEGLRKLQSHEALANVISVKQEYDKFFVKFETKEPTYLIWSSEWYPGWQATLNGERVEILRAYGFLKAIRVPEPGIYQVEFEFLPKTFIWGKYLFFIGLGLTIILAFFAFRESRSSQSKGRWPRLRKVEL